MAKQDIIVIGASAGGLPALLDLVKSIPQDFKGTLFVVLHIPAYSPSQLPSILSAAGRLPAKYPEPGETVAPGTIYVAPPDHHLLLEGKVVTARKGPKENRFRPSIDALFRSAAYTYRNRVIGVVLSGVLNDGTSGMWCIKRLGGKTIVQDPAQAEHPQMPLNVLEYTEADYTLNAEDIGPMLSKLGSKKLNKQPRLTKRELNLYEIELAIAIRDNAFEMNIMALGEPTPFTCPECNGVLLQLVEGKIIRFRCHTGHAYTASALLSDLSENVESRLWECMKGIEEMSMLLTNVSKHFASMGQRKAAKLFSTKAIESRSRAQAVHNSIFNFEVLSEDVRLPITQLKQNGREN